MAGRHLGTGKGSKITIFDVADRAGVSYSTVSRVVTGQRHVAPRTRDKVESAMAELGYVADLRARSLAGGRTRMVGVLTAELASSFVTEIVKSIDRELSQRGYDLILCTTHVRNTTEREYVAQLTNGLVEGLVILLPSAQRFYLPALQARDFPHVMVDFDELDERSLIIRSANKQGAIEATNHLLELGHRRIGFVEGDKGLSSGRERFEGFGEALSSAGVGLDASLVVEGDWRDESGYRAGLDLLQRPNPPTAIFAANDVMALGLMRSAHELGIRVPADLSLVGFDDVPEARLLTPALTTVRQPLSEIGRLATQLLVEGMEHGAMERGVRELPTELMIRQTTSSIPSESGGASTNRRSNGRFLRNGSRTRRV